MNEKRPAYTYTGMGLALGTAFGLIFWTLTGNLVFFAVGVALGLVFGAMGDGTVQGRK